MFFTRDTKHKIQQDTYIQRARMFGNRGPYLRFFELCIPESLYSDWHKCFVFHRLSLAAIRNNKGTPVWLEDKRVSAASSSSIDRTAVSVNSGEMAFEMFNYTDDIDNIISNKSADNLSRLHNLNIFLKDNHLPLYLLDFIKSFMPEGNTSIALHKTRNVGADTDYHDTLERSKGIFGSSEPKQFPKAIHHIMIVKNNYNKARIIYKHVLNVKMIKRI
jgi:hypothetical protein